MTGSEVSLGSGFGNLLWYLTEYEPERVRFIETYNLSSDKATIAAREMEWVAGKSSRCQQPLYHTSLNWHPQDGPTEEQMRKVAEGYLGHMGLEEHQALVVAHNDTAHPHVHIAVNRVHPERGKAWELDSDIGKGRGRKVDQLHNERVQQYVEAAERQYGWERVRGTYRSGPDLSDERGPSQSEYHREQRKKKQMDVFGMDPEEFDTRSVRLRALEVKDDLFYCESFQALDETLDEQGLWIQAKGQGAVFTDGSHSVKASDINRHLSGPRLEEKFGEDLGAYIEERARHIDSELGYQKLASWTYEMELEELEQLAHIKEGEKEKAE